LAKLTAAAVVVGAVVIAVEEGFGCLWI